MFAGDDAMTQTYLDVEKLLYHTVHKFIRTHGGEFDECMSIANERFLVAYKTFDGTSSFPTWVRTKVWFGLLDDLRLRTKRAAHEFCDDGTALATIAADPDPVFDLDGFLGRLSREARDIVRIVLDPPPAVAKEIALFGDGASSYRATVRGYLRHLGWTSEEIHETFALIKDALREEER